MANVRIQAYGNGEFPWADADASIADATASLPVGTTVPQGLTTVRLNGEDGPSVPLLFRDGAEDHLTFKGEPPGAGRDRARRERVADRRGCGSATRSTLVGTERRGDRRSP